MNNLSISSNGCLITASTTGIWDNTTTTTASHSNGLYINPYNYGYSGIISFISNPTSFNEIMDDGSVLIELSVPGYKKEDIKITIEKENIYFKAKIMEETKWLKSFEKSFYISSYIDKKKIKAKLENGILQVIIPLKEEFKEKEIVIE